MSCLAASGCKDYANKKIGQCTWIEQNLNPNAPHSHDAGILGINICAALLYAPCSVTSVGFDPTCCRYCHQMAVLTTDHVVARSWGGADAPSNYALVCSPPVPATASKEHLRQQRVRGPLSLVTCIGERM